MAGRTVTFPLCGVRSSNWARTKHLNERPNSAARHPPREPLPRPCRRHPGRIRQRQPKSINNRQPSLSQSHTTKPPAPCDPTKFPTGLASRRETQGGLRILANVPHPTEATLVRCAGRRQSLRGTLVTFPWKGLEATSLPSTPRPPLPTENPALGCCGISPAALPSATRFPSTRRARAPSSWRVACTEK